MLPLTLILSNMWWIHKIRQMIIVFLVYMTEINQSLIEISEPLRPKWQPEITKPTLSAKNCTSLNGHLRLPAKMSQSPLNPILKWPTFTEGTNTFTARNENCSWQLYEEGIFYISCHVLSNDAAQTSNAACLVRARGETLLCCFLVCMLALASSPSGTDSHRTAARVDHLGCMLTRCMCRYACLW